MNTNGSLERFTKEIVIGNWWGTWKERAPLPGLSFYQAVEISRWCADKYAGAHNPVVGKWFEIFNRSMGIAGYGFVIREELGLPTDRVVVCGLSVGYPDPAAPVNRFYPARAPLQEYTAWHD